jgi:hypothetical protein
MIRHQEEGGSYSPEFVRQKPFQGKAFSRKVRGYVATWLPAGVAPASRLGPGCGACSRDRKGEV